MKSSFLEHSSGSEEIREENCPRTSPELQERVYQTTTNKKYFHTDEPAGLQGQPVPSAYMLR